MKSRTIALQKAIFSKITIRSIIVLYNFLVTDMLARFTYVSPIVAIKFERELPTALKKA